MKLGQFRRDTIDNWIKHNPILADGEFAIIASDVTRPRLYDKWTCGDGLSTFEELILRDIQIQTGETPDIHINLVDEEDLGSYNLDGSGKVIKL